MSELLSKINTNTGLIFSLKDQIDVSNAFLQQEITDLQNDKYDKTGGLISGDVEISGNVALNNTTISNVSKIVFEENVILRGAKVAIGNLSGQTNQMDSGIAIGNLAGQTTQGFASIAIGDKAGQTTQGGLSIAMGYLAGRTSQGISAVAIGNRAGNLNQGTDAIAIGDFAGQNNQATRSIVLNATGAELNCATIDTCIVAPVREITGNKILQYNTTNKEICFSNTINISDNLLITSPEVDMNTQGLNIINTGGSSILDLRNEQDSVNLTLESSSGNTGLFTNDTLKVETGNIIELTPSEKRVNQLHKFGYVSHFFQSTDDDAVEYNIEPYLNDEIIPNFYTIRIGFDDRPSLFMYRNGADPAENRAVLNCAGGKALVGDENVGNNTHIEVDDPNKTIILNTENITLNGSNLESNSSNGNSGRFLRIELNGTFYKINLELD